MNKLGHGQYYVSCDSPPRYLMQQHCATLHFFFAITLLSCQIVRAENELRAAAATRAAVDPFARLSPGRRVTLSLPRRSAAALAPNGRHPNPNHVTNPDPEPGAIAGAAPALRTGRPAAVRADPGSGPSPSTPSPANVQEHRSPDGAGAAPAPGEPAAAKNAERAGKPSQVVERSASEGGERGGKPMEGAAVDPARHGHAAPCERDSGNGHKYAAQNGRVQAAAAGASGSCSRAGVIENERGVPEVGRRLDAADLNAGLAPRFAAAVLDVPAAAAAVRDCAVFIVPQARTCLIPSSVVCGASVKGEVYKPGWLASGPYRGASPLIGCTFACRPLLSKSFCCLQLNCFVLPSSAC